MNSVEIRVIAAMLIVLIVGMGLGAALAAQQIRNSCVEYRGFEGPRMSYFYCAMMEPPR